MHALYLVSVYVHILASMIWLGGALFLALVMVPLLRRMERPRAAALMRDAGTRFRAVGWVCFALLIVTGVVNLGYRGVTWGSFFSAEFHRSPFGRTTMWKLTLFVLVLVVSVFHDFVLGPRATRIVEADPTGPAALRSRTIASWVGRVNVLLGLAIVLLAVMLVRGSF